MRDPLENFCDPTIFTILDGTETLLSMPPLFSVVVIAPVRAFTCCALAGCLGEDNPSELDSCTCTFGDDEPSVTWPGCLMGDSDLGVDSPFGLRLKAIDSSSHTSKQPLRKKANKVYKLGLIIIGTKHDQFSITNDFLCLWFSLYLLHR